jgi:hypothetical protein
MIIKSTSPYTQLQIQQLSEEYEVYIKTVMDIRKRICVAGMNMHYEGETLLLKDGSDQSDLWGGGIDLETKEIDFNSFINIRPSDGNTKNEIESEQIRKLYKALSEYFFKKIL